MRLLTGDGTMHWLEAADRSFRATKASGRTDLAVLMEIGSTIAKWVAKRSPDRLNAERVCSGLRVC